MNVTCSDRDSIFEDGTPAQWAALEAHAATCAACAEEVRAWKALSVAAAEMRDYSPSPALWSRIETALAQIANSECGSCHLAVLARKNVGVVRLFAFVAACRGQRVRGFAAGFRRIDLPASDASATAATAATAAELSASDAGSAAEDAKHSTPSRKRETAYVQAIDKLAADAKPQLDKPETPLMANYREKLQVLDSAIDDLRAQAGDNPSNAHLRYQLLAMYQEKQKTLEEVLEARR